MVPDMPQAGPPDAPIPAAAPLSPVKAARRDRIIAAAEQVFLAHGYRGTSFEAVAEAATMSKVTLYTYFRDKDALFLAVGQSLSERLRAAVDRGFAAPGPLAERLAAGLVAKHRLVFEIVRRSPHADELLAARSGLLAGIFDRLDAEICATMTRMIAAEGRPEAEALAATLFNGADGCGRLAPDPESLSAQIARLASALVGP